MFRMNKCDVFRDYDLELYNVCKMKSHFAILGLLVTLILCTTTSKCPLSGYIFGSFTPFNEKKSYEDFL